MTLKESFKKEECWHRKVIILETFHLMRTIQVKTWTIKDTARDLEVSIGLVSEDLKLAKAIKADESLKDLSRNKALKKIK